MQCQVGDSAKVVRRSAEGEEAGYSRAVKMECKRRGNQGNAHCMNSPTCQDQDDVPHRCGQQAL